MSESFALTLVVFYMRHCSLYVLYVDENSHISFFMAGTDLWLMFHRCHSIMASLLERLTPFDDDDWPSNTFFHYRKRAPVLENKMHKRILVFIICEEGFPVDRSMNVQPLNDELFTRPSPIPFSRLWWVETINITVCTENCFRCSRQTTENSLWYGFHYRGNIFHVDGSVAILDEGAFVRIRHQCAGIISIKQYHNEYILCDWPHTFFLICIYKQHIHNMFTNI